MAVGLSVRKNEKTTATARISPKIASRWSVSIWLWTFTPLLDTVTIWTSGGKPSTFSSAARTPFVTSSVLASGSLTTPIPMPGCPLVLDTLVRAASPNSTSAISPSATGAPIAICGAVCAPPPDADGGAGGRANPTVRFRKSSSDS